jgi:hypothetical protein
MKRIFVALMVFVVTLFSGMNSFAADLKVHPNFYALVIDIEYSSSNYQTTSTYPNGDVKEWVLKYSFPMEDNFYDYFPLASPVVEMVDTIYLSVSDSVDFYWGIKGQCVGLVKISTNNVSGDSDTWIKGSPVNASIPPSKGTVIAYYNGQSIYPKYGGGHVAIYWGKDRNGAHILVDQNWGYMNNSQWYPDYKIRKHVLSGSGGRNSISNYHIVTK